MDETVKTRPCDEETIRRLFDEERILEGVEQGLITELPGAPTEPSPMSGQPDGTISQVVDYFSGHEWVASAHLFVLPDGTVGASGFPDPKMVLSAGVRYVLVKDV